MGSGKKRIFLETSAYFCYIKILYRIANKIKQKNKIVIEVNSTNNQRPMSQEMAWPQYGSVF